MTYIWKQLAYKCGSQLILKHCSNYYFIIILQTNSLMSEDVTQQQAGNTWSSKPIA